MYKYKYKLKRGAGIKFIKLILKPFKKRPEIVNLSGGELEKKAIYISNHSGADGPLTYEMYFPFTITGWGASGMFGNIRERRHYLYYTFYRQKLHWGRFRSFIVSTVFCPISRSIYRSIGLIPTYTDGRFMTALKISCKILDEDSPILIYPEDSEKGYINPPESFNKGFIMLSKTYKKVRKVDLPIYPCYLLNEKKNRKIVIAPPIYAGESHSQGLSDDEICALALESCQKLYFENSIKKHK